MENSVLELGQSYPKETLLQFAGIRDASDLWIELIDRARTSIDVEQFYIMSRNDSKFNDVMASIKRAVSRGVIVRILLDRIFFEKDMKEASYEHQELIKEIISSEGIELRFMDFDAATGGVLHAKFFIVDGETFWLGSQNFDWRSLEHILELGLVSSSRPLVNCLHKIFAIDWARSKDPRRAELVQGTAALLSPIIWTTCNFEGKDHQATLVSSPKAYNPECSSSDIECFLEILSGAKFSIRFQISKYTTEFRNKTKRAWNVLDSAFCEAAQRGVSVRIIVDNRVRSVPSQKHSLDQISRNNNVEVRTLKIPDSSEGFIEYARMSHSKILVVDDIYTWIGSSNCSPDDFITSRNVGIIVNGEKFAQKVAGVFDHAWKSQYACKLGLQ